MAAWRGLTTCTVIAAGLIAAFLLLRHQNPTDHRGRVPLTSIGGEVIFLDAPAITRRGPPQVVIVRLAGPGELVPFHFRQQALAWPKTIEGWAEVLRAPVIFNAGQFDEHFAHLGWLKGDGVWLSRRRQPLWFGLLVSGPKRAGSWARLIDLQDMPTAVVDGYAHAIQSMMLVDQHAQPRVRRSDRTACRTVVAEDRHGRILIIVTQGAVTLMDLAQWLPRSGLEVVRAMNLDGGVESQLIIDTPELHFVFYGQYGTDTTMLRGEAGALVRHELPAVVALRPQLSSVGHAQRPSE